MYCQALVREVPTALLFFNNMTMQRQAPLQYTGIAWTPHDIRRFVEKAVTESTPTVTDAIGVTADKDSVAAAKLEL